MILLTGSDMRDYVMSPVVVPTVMLPMTRLASVREMKSSRVKSRSVSMVTSMKSNLAGES